VRIEPLLIETTFIVIEHITKLMLSIEWLQENNARWDFHLGSLKVGGWSFPLKTVARKNHCRRVVTTECTTIPPNTQGHVNCRAEFFTFDSIQSDERNLQHNQLKKCVKVMPAVIPNKMNQISVFIVNNTDYHQCRSVNSFMTNMYANLETKT